MATASIPVLPTALRTSQHASRQALHAVTLEHTVEDPLSAIPPFSLNASPCNLAAVWTSIEHVSMSDFLRRAQASSLAVLSLPSFSPYDYGLLIIPFAAEWHAWPITRHGYVRRYDEIIPTASQRARWITIWRQLAQQWMHICQAFEE